MTAGAAVIVTIAFMAGYGVSLTALRDILLCHMLILAGAADIATREIPDRFHLLIVLTGLIGFRPVSALSGFLLVPLPFLIAALKTGKIGGGDVKLMAASGFALGVFDGFRMMFWGLLTALLWHLIVDGEKDSLPLVPFLAFGCFVSLFS